MIRITRPPVRRQAIIDELSKRIVDGTLPLGSRLPPRLDLGEQFHVSLGTVQTALDRMVRDGFLCVKAGQGTFVADTPPHLFQYGILFRHQRNEETSPFWTLLMQEAQLLSRDSPRRFCSYYGICGQEKAVDHIRLQEDIRANCLAGLVFTDNPACLNQSSVFELPAIPKVGIICKSEIPDLPIVYPDFQSFRNRALDELRHLGRSRLALLTTIGNPEDESLMAWIDAARCRKMRILPHWIQNVHPDCRKWARRLAHTLMRKSEDGQPDGLIITDDSLVEHASAGLLDAGIRIGQDADVVAHCNFPEPKPSVVAIRRLGFDIGAILQASLDSIDDQRRGKSVPLVTLIPARFEDEKAPWSGNGASSAGS